VALVLLSWKELLVSAALKPAQPCAVVAMNVALAQNYAALAARLVVALRSCSLA